MKTKDIRQTFVNYFKKHKHELVSSSRLIPENDPTLLFINAGMNQFKNIFLGHEDRSYDKAVSVQKCVRAGGKHNDLENVGHTARHLTFFQMLGNFSFGDYFKKEAIHYAWDFSTQVLGLPKDRLYVSVFETDNEAADIWHKQESVPKDRIYRFGEKDNFWRMGNTGPCGPCSEIFYDLGPEVGGDPKQNVMGGEGDRFIEFWNLVFMQFHEDENGKMNPLPNPSVDTGMGLERLAALMQGQVSVYHTDAFQDIIAQAGKMSGTQYVVDTEKAKAVETIQLEETNVALRVLADHARTTAFLMADKVLPSNEGRGYVLRRIMRRAIRYGRKLSDNTGLLPGIVEAVVAQMSDTYPELSEQKELILNSTKDEEKRFLSTLDQGTEILSNELSRLKNKGQKTLDGQVAFKLYDTYGFPFDLTQIMTKEQGVEVDEPSFKAHMEKAKEKARASWKSTSLAKDMAHMLSITQDLNKKQGATRFTGYNHQVLDRGCIQLLSDGKKLVSALESEQNGLIALDKTCFYAEGGGQVGDHGVIKSQSGGHATVLSCVKHNDIHLLQVEVTGGQFKVGEEVLQEVHSHNRKLTAANHSATHLMHSALKKVLGDHISQAGSLVDPNRLRFDFTHNKSITIEELQQIEDLVNQEISCGEEISTRLMTPDKAKEAGALALFGEKYGKEVRVVKMGEFSMELCGGTHVSNTSMIRLFKIVSENGVSAGVRRIEALTSDKAFDYVLKHTRQSLNVREQLGLSEGWNQFLKEPQNKILDWADKAKKQQKDLQKQVQNIEQQQIDIDKIIDDSKKFNSSVGEAHLILADLDMEDRQVLSSLTDKIRDKIQTGIVVVVGKGGDSHPMIVSVTKNLTKDFNADQILKEMAKTMKGRGGGRSDFAQGAAKDRSQLQAAFAKASHLIGL